MLGVVIGRPEEAEHLGVVLDADGAQQRGDRDLSLPVDLDAEQVLVARLNSSQAPRFGITFAANRIGPVAGSSAPV